ncbi:hypothetical protein C8R43DRAFT_560623 [Mycena crocata]|nr:hypothetical protein C8R43DRAFT_560623 [Mycena crocata]
MSLFALNYFILFRTVQTKRGSISVGTVAGCVVGGIIVLILLVLSLVAFKRKRQRQKQSPTLPVLEPFKASPQNFNPESRTRSESPAALVRQLQTALATVVALRQAPAQAAPPTGNMLGTQTTLSESSYDTPPPVYRSHDRRSIRKSPAMI